MADYSGIRLYAVVYRKYKDSDGEKREEFGYMSTVANTVAFFGLENIFHSGAGGGIIEYKAKKATNKRAGNTTTAGSDGGGGQDTRFKQRGARNSNAAGQKNIRILTWDQIGDQEGSHHTVGFRIPKIITNTGVCQIIGALLKNHISVLPPATTDAKKCRNVFTIDGKRHNMITDLPPEADRYYAGGDIIETAAEMEQVVQQSEIIADLNKVITGEK